MQLVSVSVALVPLAVLLTATCSRCISHGAQLFEELNAHLLAAPTLVLPLLFPQRNGADFSVFVNTAQEFDGSDSGARPDEAVSWGKIKVTATPVKVRACWGRVEAY